MQLSLEKIHNFLERIEAAADDAAMRRLFADFEMEYDLDLPSDPFCEEYRARQFQLYEQIAGKRYLPSNEVSSFNIDEMAKTPFPFVHKSSELVGNHLLAIGYIIRLMQLPPGSKILEFGPGWGNTTLFLSKMGYSVTAVDIEQNFVDLINLRAAMERLEVNVICDDFSYIERISEKFDAILFFECFHHAQDHLKLISSFDRVLSDGGIVCFGAEPILEEFPIPWGLRMDGESIWAVSKNGWLELGFNREYFFEALARYGFVGTEYIGQDGPWSKAVIAKRRRDLRQILCFYDGELRNTVGTLLPDGLFVQKGEKGVVAHGPYRELNRGRWRASVMLGKGSQNEGVLEFDVVDDFGMKQVLEKYSIDLGKVQDTIVIDFSCEERLTNFEIRLFSPGESEFIISNIILEYLGSDI